LLNSGIGRRGQAAADLDIKVEGSAITMSALGQKLT
jgi:hypothetical protein